MSLVIDPLHPLFAAEVSGIDLREPLVDEQVQRIESLMAKYAVLVFRGQPLSDDEHARFTRHFGAIDKGLNLATDKQQRLANDDVIDIANVGDDGQVFEPAHIRNVSLMANQLWHSDSSFKDPPARYSILCGVTVPESGGQTEFADQRAAWDALDDETQSEIENLVAEHWAFHSRNQLGGGDYSPQGMERLPPVHWPMVHVIPESGRKSLFIGVHTREIVGMATAPARVFLLDLLEHATQREFVFRHHWRQHDLVMWDNRCTLHRGRRYDLGAARELRRCTTEVTAA